jgi:hypothetical protein
MNKIEILALRAGQLIELQDGNRAKINSVYVDKELVEFEYIESKFKRSANLPSLYDNPDTESQDLSADLNVVQEAQEKPIEDPPTIDPPPITPVILAAFGLTQDRTVVICDWHDLVNAVLA